MNSRLEPRQINEGAGIEPLINEEQTASSTQRDDELVIENSNRALRIGLVAAGTLFLGLGLIGIVVPILPTTPFLLLAAACYCRSSRRAYRWLMHNRLFGVHLRNYREGKGMALWPKVGTLVLLWLVLGYTSCLVIPVLYGKLVLLLIALGVTIHLLRIPTAR